jgi:small subunit ribosomal protein S1
MAKILFGTEEDLLEMQQAEKDFGGEILSDDSALEAYLSTMNGLEVGKVVNGTVRQITGTEVLIDVAFKSEGVVDLEEFRDQPDLAVGSTVEVYIEALEDSEGRLVLSKQRADFIRVWEKIHEAFQNGEIVRGKLARRIKGGVVVDLFGIEAFLPGSQIDLRQIPDIGALIGQDMDLKVIKVNKARRNIVVSRRVVLEEERSRLRGDILETLEKNQVRKGVVKNITDFGAFIDLGGVDGLLHITDMSYKRINHPSEMVSLGMELEVKVLDFNENKERISLGLKQLQDHPWKNAMAKFPEGSVVAGKVVSVTDYGAFVELEDGVEGLIHVSEMSWTQHVKHPSKLVTIGQELSCVVLKIDVENEKISLGLKQLETDPWEDIETQLPPGAKVTGEIRNLASFGAFVEIKEGVDGLIHVSDMSWTKKIQHPSEMLKKGDKVECIVLAVDREKRRISLSIKHMEDDPWDTVATRFPLGTEVKGSVVRLLDRGVVVELENGMEGFVPTSKLSTEHIKVPSEAFRVADEIIAHVVEIDHNNRKLFLSIVEWLNAVDAATAQAFLDAHKPGSIQE